MLYHSNIIAQNISLFTKILIPLTNPGELLQNQLAWTEIHSSGFFIIKNNPSD